MQFFSGIKDKISDYIDTQLKFATPKSKLSVPFFAFSPLENAMAALNSTIKAASAIFN